MKTIETSQGILNISSSALEFLEKITNEVGESAVESFALCAALYFCSQKDVQKFLNSFPSDEFMQELDTYNKETE